MRASDFLEEKVRDAFLYHSTYVDHAARIINMNEISGKTEHRTRLPFGQPSTIAIPKHVDKYGNVAGVSLTRSLSFAKAWRSNEGVILVLDQTKLRANHLVRPFLYYRSPEKMHQNKREAEEFVIGQKGITPLDRYLVEILMSRDTYEWCMNEVEDTVPPEESLYYNLVNHPSIRLI